MDNAGCQVIEIETDEFLQLVEAQRQRAQRILRARSARIRDFDVELDEQFRALIQEIAGSRAVAEIRQYHASVGEENLPPEMREQYDLRSQELDRWEARLKEKEEKLQRQSDELAAQPPPTDDAETSRLDAVLEDARREIRQLKQQNRELVARLGESAAGAASEREVDADSTEMNWELQKMILMAELESQSESDDKVQKEERRAVNDAIAKTDRIVRLKDAEIENLKRLLCRQSGNIGSIAVGAAAISDMLDQDELIRQERESLKRMQEEWKEKLRRIEVETSLERAKLGRERVEMEEKVRALEAALVKHGITLSVEKVVDKNSVGGRWLAQLGLGKNDTE